MSGIWLLKKIVKNDAMKTDPKEIYGWRVFLLACSACFGAASFGWDSGVIGGVIKLDTFIEDYKLGDGNTVDSANLQANIVSVLQAGCFAGALAAYPLADLWGRKWCLIYASIFTLAGVILQAAASGHLEPLYIGRFIAGLGVGAASVVNPIYVSENAPRAIRGLLTGMYQLFIVTGSLIAFWTNFGANLHFRGATKYIVPLAVQGLPALFLFSLMLMCNESPRYLARKDRWEEAKSVLQRLRQLPEDHPYFQEEFTEIASQLEQERQLMGDATFMSLQKEMWQVKTNRHRAILSILLMVFQQLTGTNAINVYAPTIFTNLGIMGTSNSLLGTGVYGIVKVVSCAIFLLFMADSLGRRRSLLVSAIGQSFCMFYIGIYVRVAPPQEGDPVPVAGYFALAFIYVFAAFFQFGWGPACWILVSEIPKARLRPLNVALAAATQWLFNFVVARTLPVMLATLGEGGYGTYFIYGSFGVIMLTFVYFFVPETKGVSLEHMGELFGEVPVESKEAGDDKPAPVELPETKGSQRV
ncbi:putative quinate permease [Rosellinia necatrix]|uniref:Putative quinate permease n=1 Tax=Rosellinia necatrix TaxID=77044 RepID=A0A1W2TC06_ROSNE|nr:putative quinate permease [Rosellinia necatrix]